jgi:hypothetical protein
MSSPEKGKVLGPKFLKAYCLLYVSLAVQFSNSAFSSHMCINVFRMVFKINNDYFPKRHYQINLCNGEPVHFKILFRL